MPKSNKTKRRIIPLALDLADETEQRCNHRITNIPCRHTDTDTCTYVITNITTHRRTSKGCSLLSGTKKFLGAITNFLGNSQQQKMKNNIFFCLLYDESEVFLSSKIKYPKSIFYKLVRLKHSSALQSQKWQLINMGQ